MDIRVSKESIALEAVRYNKQSGLVPVVVQSSETGEVLMQAYANREALKRTLGTGQAWFWSRSRADYWRKGSTSGNTLNVTEVRLDCDGDCVLYLVEAAGPACHTGEVSCFYRTVTHHDSSTQNQEATSSVTLPDSVASQQGPVADFSRLNEPVPFSELSALWQVISERDEQRPNGSYTTYLFEHGVDKVAKKVGEEASEVIIAAKNTMNDPSQAMIELAKESADLLFHLFALWRMCKMSPNEVLAVLQERSM